MNDQQSEYNISTLSTAHIQKQAGENPERLSKETHWLMQAGGVRRKVKKCWITAHTTVQD